MTPWLDIVGVAADGTQSPFVQDLVEAAEFVIGPHRLIGDVPLPLELPPIPYPGGGGGSPTPPPKWVLWEPPLERMVQQVTQRRGHKTVILATGDPLWFGIAATLTRHLGGAEFRVHPNVTAFQLAAARLRWPLQHVTTLSLHGRPIELLHPHLVPGNRILALTTDATTAPHVARLLTERGYGGSPMSILENLGQPDEAFLSGIAETFAVPVGDFYVLAINCFVRPDTPLLPPVPGLPDDAFVSDGQLTKREVRAATLARLAPYAGALLWDVGAGCGSVAIEWMRAARDARAIAFEREGERLQMIAVNAGRLGVPTLQLQDGEAPASFAGMPKPDAVFLGGGVADEALFQHCWAALRRGGRFVANAVTVDGEQALYQRQAEFGGELVRIDVSVLDTIGEHRVLRPRMPVTQWSVIKP